MRGLDTRVMLAKARILILVDNRAGNELLNAVRAIARAEGRADADAGINKPPLMFVEDADLWGPWEIGHREVSRELAEFERFNALEQAVYDGYGDWKAGRKEAPASYKTDPKLLRAWNDGQSHAATDEILSACAECHNSDGFPCRVHG